MSVTAAQLAALAQGAHSDEAAAFESRIADEAAGRADERMAEALASAAALWVTTFGDLDARGSGSALADLLRAVAERVQRALSGLGRRSRRILAAAIPEALALGVRQAQDFARRASGHRVHAATGSGAGPLERTLDAARGLPRMVREQLDRALRLLTPEVVDGRTFAAVAAGMGAARSAISRVRGTVAWAVHDALNTGIGYVARALRLRRVWVAEFNACVRCQAYAGESVTLRGTFKGGQSWDPAQRHAPAAPVDAPPLHIRCRCRTALWSERWPVRGESLPDLLTRQAREAVGRGWSLPSESGAARLRAARALLTSGEQLPPGVASAARRALREGRFPYRTAAAI
ncbi:hypothetical protein GCM10010193_70470 [Kitasatospora atroaurantiaca]|uniref:SPP1 gp7 family phage head morphogenesis protein n=1 Tax=Kitasatospora atroaurantiaca TaxID=285545 RepID=A0A561ENG8_9ACTN|nr:hypothetical protein [Kitasatospora atroaurantiaca]TWE17132.1 hypothetical protein FB465_2137 [Kitasatospora atroaurantiaca]